MMIRIRRATLAMLLRPDLKLTGFRQQSANRASGFSGRDRR
jgi:hypothetical protein